VSCHVTEANENAEESDIVDARETKKMRTMHVRRE
jgi:hypothetical protein